MSPHYCHATDCKTPVSPSMLMCLKHWRMVPKRVQNRIWATYRPGQEKDKQPSELYMGAYRAAVNSVDAREKRPLTFPGELQ